MAASWQPCVISIRAHFHELSMACRVPNSRRNAAGDFVAAALVCVFSFAVARDALAADAVTFVAPANRLPQTTVSVNAPPAPETNPAPNAAANPPAIDFADLAAFVQLDPAAPEAIQGEPLPTEGRSLRPITQVTIDASLPEGLVPGGPGVEQPGVPLPPWPTIEDPRLWGGWAEMDFQWSATRFCHRPLYFEQVNVERYGYTVSPILQPAISGAHFFLSIPALPYKMTVHPPRECIYTLGYYRAGSRVPRRWHHLPWDPTAATVEGLVATGLVFLIP
jgi:hypothetical protein